MIRLRVRSLDRRANLSVALGVAALVIAVVTHRAGQRRQANWSL